MEEAKKPKPPQPGLGLFLILLGVGVAVAVYLLHPRSDGAVDLRATWQGYSLGERIASFLGVIVSAYGASRLVDGLIRWKQR